MLSRTVRDVEGHQERSPSRDLVGQAGLDGSGTPIRWLCTPRSTGSADVSALLPRMLMRYRGCSLAQSDLAIVTRASNELTLLFAPKSAYRFYSGSHPPGQQGGSGPFPPIPDALREGRGCCRRGGGLLAPPGGSGVWRSRRGGS